MPQVEDVFKQRDYERCHREELYHEAAIFQRRACAFDSYYRCDHPGPQHVDGTFSVPTHTVSCVCAAMARPKLAAVSLFFHTVDGREHKVKKADDADCTCKEPRLPERFACGIVWRKS